MQDGYHAGYDLRWLYEIDEILDHKTIRMNLFEHIRYQYMITSDIFETLYVSSMPCFYASLLSSVITV